MKPEAVKQALNDSIQIVTDNKWLFSVSPGGITLETENFHLHAKKVEFIHQEIFAKLTMYNFCESITQSVVIQQEQKKYAYKVNFSDAVHICFEFFLGNVPPPNVEAKLMRYISPIRPGRKDTRKQTQKPVFSFTYRVA